jgi:hypothetical protein
VKKSQSEEEVVVENKQGQQVEGKGVKSEKAKKNQIERKNEQMTKEKKLKKKKGDLKKKQVGGSKK